MGYRVQVKTFIGIYLSLYYYSTGGRTCVRSAERKSYKIRLAFSPACLAKVETTDIHTAPVNMNVAENDYHYRHAFNINGHKKKPPTLGRLVNQIKSALPALPV